MQEEEKQGLLLQEEINFVMGLDGDEEKPSDEKEEDVQRVLEYITNKNKTKSKYVSGYMCEPETALEKFQFVWKMATMYDDKPPEFLKKEILSFHLVQSFPEDLNISDEEVHQCGIELLERINKHQGVVCSHVHPVVDELGEVHGKCKHNHILFNAYIEPTKIDPDHPNRKKYNDCNETYQQLQLWNDEIAIEHGLPIIQDPDLKRRGSWTESTEAHYGRSWKEYVRWDIDHARREANNWDEFVKNIEKAGYMLRGRKTLTYITPSEKPYEGKRIRATTLGQEYTKENLELFWALRDRIDAEVLETLKGEKVPVLFALSLRYEGPLTVDVPLGLAGKKEKKYYALPLVKSDRSREALASYFDGRELYTIRDATGAFVSKATGAEVFSYLNTLRCGEEELFYWLKEEEKKKEEAQLRELWARLDEEEKEKRKRREESEQKARQRTEELKYYYVSQYKNTRTGEPYKTYLYDKNGRKRTSIDLLFMLAITIIKDEGGLWDDPNPPLEKINEPIFGPPNWKAENMLKAMHMAEEEGLYTFEDICEHLQHMDTNYSRAKEALKRNEKRFENMKKVACALEDYKKNVALIERIEALPQSEEKEQLEKQYAEDISKYSVAKRRLSVCNLLVENKPNAEGILDFQEQYKEIGDSIQSTREFLEISKERFRKIRWLQYQTYLAESKFFCYGPKYSPESAEEKRNALSDEKNPPSLIATIKDAAARSSAQPQAAQQKTKGKEFSR